MAWKEKRGLLNPEEQEGDPKQKDEISASARVEEILNEVLVDG